MHVLGRDNGSNLMDGRMMIPENRILMLRARIENEFRELPGLRLTRWQAARLWSLDAAECDAVLKHMVAARVLRETSDGYMAGQIPAARAGRSLS